MHPMWLGFYIVLGASIVIALALQRFSRRKLIWEEILSANWVALAIYVAVLAIYVGLKIPLGLSRSAHVPAVVAAVCVSLIATSCLVWRRVDWKVAVMRSLFGVLFILFGASGAVLLFR